MDQVADRFYAAVRTLAGDGPLKQRLIGAYVAHLESLGEDEVPEAIRPRFEALRAAMAAVPPTEKETAVQVSVRKMSQAEANRLVRSIVTMLAELVRVKATGERLGAGEAALAGFGRPSGAGIRVPEFLARSAG